MSPETPDFARTKMTEIIAAHTQGKAVDWSKAASEYFAWWALRGLSERAHAFDSEMNAGAASELNEQRAFRAAAEAAVRARLVDPDSAKFEWPYKFVQGFWKPFLSKRITGYVTCGRVNARNRMGGYAGSSAVAVVLNEERVVQYVEIGQGRDFDPTEASCQKAAASLPIAPAELDTPPPEAAASSSSVAEELEKLASLRDRGIITSAEFDAQKTKLLGEH